MFWSVLALLIRGRNLNQKYVREVLSSEVKRYSAEGDAAGNIPVSSPKGQEIESRFS